MCTMLEKEDHWRKSYLSVSGVMTSRPLLPWYSYPYTNTDSTCMKNTSLGLFLGFNFGLNF